ncbi:MAG TPA: hypothetical protein VFS00_20685 [Polyangiaceae bacterium]|nr:hypothetical protein [Polyangiaceae bacterium]
MNSARFVEQWEKRLRREGKAEGKAEGLREGEARGRKGLRLAIETICEVFGIPLTPTRQARLEAMGGDELKELCLALKEQRRWPRRGER